MKQFLPAVREWFQDSLGVPTTVQTLAWEQISAGRNALIVAPTGSGKTLAAFLWAIDRLLRRGSEGTRVLYISPMKALGVDVQKNLSVPLKGIGDVAGDPTDVSVGVRSGDTPAAKRRRLVKHPPDILITTPESLYLMLTSNAAEALRNVETVIIDEVHALAGNKRGAHLALSLERLDALLAQPAQRIGLSATVSPLDEVARFVGGVHPVDIVAPASDKQLVTRIEVPLADMSNPQPENQQLGVGLADGGEHRVGSAWPTKENAIYRRVLQSRSTIIFANSRRLAERLTSALNEQHAKEKGEDVLDLARAHHGSVSKESRLEVEDQLKNGKLQCVVATASLELGIDMGPVDQVIQIDPPPSVASGLQRIGRSGHQVGQESKMAIYPVHQSHLLECATVALMIHSRQIEDLHIPQYPLDILAGQTVAAASRETLEVEEWYRLVCRAAPYRDLPRKSFEGVLDTLSGKYPSTDFADLKPRLVWDRTGGTLRARPGAKQLAILSGSTIPDRGLYRVEVANDDGSASSRIGELDEEMVHESRVGEVFLLGTSAWRIREITPDRVKVVPAPGQRGKIPFWRGNGRLVRFSLVRQ